MCAVLERSDYLDLSNSHFNNFCLVFDESLFFISCKRNLAIPFTVIV